MLSLVVQLLHRLQGFRTTDNQRLQRLLLAGCCVCLRGLCQQSSPANHSVGSRCIAPHISLYCSTHLIHCCCGADYPQLVIGGCDIACLQPICWQCWRSQQCTVQPLTDVDDMGSTCKNHAHCGLQLPRQSPLFAIFKPGFTCAFALLLSSLPRIAPTPITRHGLKINTVKAGNGQVEKGEVYLSLPPRLRHLQC